MEPGLELVVGRQVGQSQEGSVACREMPEYCPSAS